MCISGFPPGYFFIRNSSLSLLHSPIPLFWVMSALAWDRHQRAPQCCLVACGLWVYLLLCFLCLRLLYLLSNIVSLVPLKFPFQRNRILDIKTYPTGLCLLVVVLACLGPCHGKYLSQQKDETKARRWTNCSKFKPRHVFGSLKSTLTGQCVNSGLSLPLLSFRAQDC